MIKQEELITRCKQGDPAAYTGLYNLHAKTVYSSILRLVNHTGEAEDILQDSFVAAFKSIASLKESSGFRSWVKRIAINKSIDLVRKRKLRFVELETEWMPDREDEDLIDEDAFAYNMDAVNAAIDALPEGYRTIFNLYAIEEIPHTQIAELLGLENGTVRTQYHRAKHRILQTLKQGSYHE
ncbi:RNA polymerase sigma factor [Mucilaginibacter sp. dw_454]|uniref:RNA polymerase sigma factor n=1 Tax=Mucilaginibacter sp. dw_454 TaxID=2720079 RepID=UPI001BD5F6FF|nr:RNA polymerase sigma factor [Mucilaginibacter sp. dw_454]